MINIGQFNTLKVVKQVEFGVYLDGGERGEILLPRRYVPPTTQLNDALDVFIYFDSDDCLIATTEKPKIHCGQCALLTVKMLTAWAPLWIGGL